MAFLSLALMPLASTASLENEATAQYDGFTELPRQIYYLPNAAALAGCWGRDPYVGSFYGETVNFSKDGSYLRIYAGGIDPRVSQEGTWQFEEYVLTVSISSQTVHEGGEIRNPGGDSGTFFVGGADRVQKIDPPIVLKYEVMDLMIQDDPSSPEEGNSQLTMYFEEEQLWKISDRPKALGDEYYID